MTPSLTTERVLHRTAVVHISIASAPERLVAFLSDVTQWKTWAPWVRSVERASPGQWVVGTDDGPLRIRFVEANSFGVLDHEVTIDSGMTLFNSMRVLPNATGSELVVVLFQLPTVPREEFDRDVEAVRVDLRRIKDVAEAMARER